MKCPSCGKPVPETKFCVFCGTSVVRHCPQCNKIVETSNPTCPSCNYEFYFHEDAMALLKEGEKLEKKHQYEDAVYKYESIKKPHNIRQEAEQRMQTIRTKIDNLAEKRALGEKALKAGSIKTAQKAFLEVQEILPKDKHAQKALLEITPLLKKKAIKTWILAISILIILGFLGWEGYRNTLSYRTKEELVKLLGSQDLYVRTSAAFTLAMHGQPEGVSVLRVLSNSNDERKRLYSFTALFPFAEQQATRGLREVLYNGSVPAKIGAGWALINHGDTLSAVRLGMYLSDKDDNLRIASAVLLFNLGYSEGLPEINKNLESNSPETKFKTLYALYLLGDKEMLSAHIGEWAGKVRKLLKDESDDVRLITAFLLNKINPNLAKEDSTLIECILWDGFLKSKDKVTPKLKELPEVQAFYLAKDVINNEGDEELAQLLPSASEVRQICQLELSKIELGDKSVLKTAENRMNSKNPMEQLYGAIVGYKLYEKKAEGVLKRLLKIPDENVKLLTCKTLYEFVIR